MTLFAQPVKKSFFRNNLANLITLGRIPLCFGSCGCAIMVMKSSPNSSTYAFVGAMCIILASLTDYFDGLVARKLGIVTRIGPLADQMMDKVVYCIIFPTLAVGVMARDHLDNINHVMFFLVLCVTFLVRDHYVNFLRVLADRHNGDSGVKNVGKIRTMLALPTACIMYGYCFSSGEPDELLYLNTLVVWVRSVDVKHFIILEISLMVINIVSAISYTRQYGSYFLDEVCDGDEHYRKKILYIFPSALTLMNAIMGISAVVLANYGKFHIALVLLITAAIFDKLDGAAARKLGLVEEPVPGERKITLGAILDDLADLVSFCLAPVGVAFAYLGDQPYKYFLLIYALAGISRLIYFTLDKNPIPGSFKGLPSPAAALLCGGGVLMAFTQDPTAQNSAFFIFFLFIFNGLMMNIFFIPYVHFGQMMSRSKGFSRMLFTFVSIICFSDYLGVTTVVLLFIYLLSPIYVKFSKHA